MFWKAVFYMTIVCTPMFAHADELTAAKRADIVRLIEVTGATKIAEQFAGAITKNFNDSIKTVRPDVPPRFFDILHSEMMALLTEKMNAPGGLVDICVPIYAKYFTDAEIQELLAFYLSDIGRKTIQVMPAIVAESMVAGQQWGRSLGPEINQRVMATLKREGIELPKKQ